MRTKLEGLEARFWRSMVDEDTDTALSLLTEPAMMESSHGAMKFDHAAQRKMAEQGTMVIADFKLAEMEVVFTNEATAVLTYQVEQAVAPRGTKSEAVTQTMTDSSTWAKSGNKWLCGMCTETAVESGKAKV
ncbi:MAG: nuclear transport factor 2 family protein [Burkholderiales bacterium]